MNKYPVWRVMIMGMALINQEHHLCTASDCGSQFLGRECAAMHRQTSLGLLLETSLDEAHEIPFGLGICPVQQDRTFAVKEYLGLETLPCSGKCETIGIAPARTRQTNHRRSFTP